MKRIQSLRPPLAAEGVDVFLSTCEFNIQYLTGFTGEDAALLVTAEETFLVLDSRFIEQAREDIPDFPVMARKGGLGSLVRSFAHERGLTVLGLEGNRLSHFAFARLAWDFGGETRALDNVVESLRSRKDPEEIEIMVRACAVAGQALVAAKEVMRPGVTEKDVSDRIEAEIRARGGYRTSFDISVLSAMRSSQPHGRPSLRKLMRGDPLLIDFGAFVDFYLSDLTRVYFVSSMDDWWKRIYSIVLEAQKRAIEAVRPGRPLKEVDLAAREHIEAEGFKDAFTHGVGHGVGREIHEPPGVGPRSEQIMEPGMVFTVEPGLYFPNRGGIRIEDIVVVEENGVRVLSDLEKGLGAAIVRD
jgi:Xaa-Pro aminopeptidase